MKALITCLVSGEYTIYDENSKKTLIAKPRGIFRNNNSSPKVGDIVEYTEGTPHAIITKVYDRHNDFIRPAIANIDQAFIVTSVLEPSINTNLLDRMIIIFEYQNITPILVFSKIDLLNEVNTKKEVFDIIDYYEKIGYTVIKTSKIDTISVDDIKCHLKGKISVITGQSGVGKSSILNLIDTNLNEDTNEISKALNRGKHTTRYTKLFYVEEGWLADSPGFGTMDLFDMSEVDVSHSFVEFFDASHNCKYKGCLHLNEPSCKVKELLDKKEILSSRYNNYIQFVNEIKSKRKW